MNLKDFAKKVELKRFLMDMGRHEFAKAIGINYRTYMSFVKGERVPWTKNLDLIVAFMEKDGKKYPSLKIE